MPMRVRKSLIGFIAVIQSILFLVHALLYETWTFSSPGRNSLWIQLAVGFLSLSFVAASLFAFRYTNAALRAFERPNDQPGLPGQLRPIGQHVCHCRLAEIRFTRQHYHPCPDRFAEQPRPWQHDIVQRREGEMSVGLNYCVVQARRMPRL